MGRPCCCTGRLRSCPDCTAAGAWLLPCTCIGVLRCCHTASVTPEQPLIASSCTVTQLELAASTVTATVAQLELAASTVTATVTWQKVSSSHMLPALLQHGFTPAAAHKKESDELWKVSASVNPKSTVSWMELAVRSAPPKTRH